MPLSQPYGPEAPLREMSHAGTEGREKGGAKNAKVRPEKDFQLDQGFLTHQQV